MPNSYAGVVRTLRGEWVPVSTNEHVSIPLWADLEWSYIEANKELFAILRDGAAAARLPLLARVFDLKAWFRQLAIDTTDKWKHICYVRGNYARIQDYIWKRGVHTFGTTTQSLNCAPAHQHRNPGGLGIGQGLFGGENAAPGGML